MSDALEAKAMLRRIFRARRDQFVTGLPDLTFAAQASALSARVIARLAGTRCVAGFVAIGSEADPAPILAEAARRGIEIALPWVDKLSEPMRFLSWKPGDPLEPGPFGLMQPGADAPEVVPDLVLVPLLAFDRYGGRLGQGAGYYDRALAELRAVRTIGVAWSVQEIDRVPLDPWDVPIEAIATECDWIEAEGCGA